MLENQSSASQPSDATSKPTTPQPSPLEKLKSDSDLLLMLYPKDRNGNFSKSIAPEDEITVYDLLQSNPTSNKNLLILLDTSGGNVYSAVKIMDTLREKYKHITIAIPQEAKSSGTMMCCGANALIMSSTSELGPLDKPMINPRDETVIISALDIVKSIDGMLDIAEIREREYAERLTEAYGLLIKDTLEQSSKSISRLISPMLCQEDVKIYNQAKRLLAIAERYGEELLKEHMLNYIDKDVRENIAKLVTRRLVWLYPDHSFAIRRNELRNLLFKVQDSEEVPYWEYLWNEFKINIGVSKEKVIKFI